MMKRFTSLPLYSQILIGLFLGIVLGGVLVYFELDTTWVKYYIKPFGKIFTNLLKMIAVPLVFVSLIVGVASLNDVRKLSGMGGKTIGIYLFTTFIAIVLGLILVNLIKPGEGIPVETKEALLAEYSGTISTKLAESRSKTLEDQGPLTSLINMVPSNIFSSASKNTSMLQIVVVAILMGIATMSLSDQKKKPFLEFCDSLNEVILKLIDFIMKVAPFGVFALIAAMVVEAPDPSILVAIGYYSVTVLIGLLIMMLGVYPTLLVVFTKMKYLAFFKAIKDAQLLAFSTSSSSATLPVTMTLCEQNLKIPERVTSFVLPLGATINMDGTSLYQAVAAVFIAQVMGNDLSLAQQITIVFTALLTSIGTAGVPGAGMIMLSIVLASVNIPEEYIALIFAPDRILDMCRTVVNVTGDITVTAIVASSEKE